MVAQKKKKKWLTTIFSQQKTVIKIRFIFYRFVRTRFITTRNSIGLARKKAQTISFVERGFERLDLIHQVVSLFVVFIHD